MNYLYDDTCKIFEKKSNNVFNQKLFCPQKDGEFSHLVKGNLFVVKLSLINP